MCEGRPFRKGRPSFVMITETNMRLTFVKDTSNQRIRYMN
jgi:hypothetical protein